MFTEFQDYEDWAGGWEVMTAEQAAEKLGEHIDDTSNIFGGDTVRLMPCGMWITNLGNGWFNALVQHDEYQGDWASVSKSCYFEWAVSEMFEDPTTDQMCDLMTAWAAWQGVPPASADEMACDPRIVGDKPWREKTHRERVRSVWLKWFIEKWEEVQDREDAAAMGGRS